jgi:hypothetical protein
MDYWHYANWAIFALQPFIAANLDFFTSIQYFPVCFALFKGNIPAEYVY